MNKNLLNTEVQDYITNNLKTDIHSILLGKNDFPNVSSRELVEQLESKGRAQKKLPTWFSTPNIYYPNKLNISQTSSEVTARYKAELMQGNTILDVTGGFGVDTFYFSKRFQKVFHIEKEQQLSKIAEHNFKQLGVTNIESINAYGIEFLKSTEESIDWIYLDPSRRDNRNKKVYFLQDCEPDVTLHLVFLFSKSENILIKTGPLLDLSMGMSQLEHVREIHIVSVENEVKEILWILKKQYVGNIKVKTIDISKDRKNTFQFDVKELNESKVEYSEPMKYLYEPNSAIMKSGAFNLIGKKYGLKKLEEHAHLYTSEILIPFPGRKFIIEKVFPYHKKMIKQLGLDQANITTRNFPESVAQIRKKTKLRDGGKTYLFFTKDLNGKLIVIIGVKS